jgi:hypothetical protein
LLTGMFTMGRPLNKCFMMTQGKLTWVVNRGQATQHMFYDDPS